MPPAWVDQLTSKLESSLERVGITSRIDAEPIPPTKLYRVAVISDDFENLRHSERQELVWRIARDEMPPDDWRRISMIMTLTTTEAGSEASWPKKRRRAPR